MRFAASSAALVLARQGGFFACQRRKSETGSNTGPIMGSPDEIYSTITSDRFAKKITILRKKF